MRMIELLAIVYRYLAHTNNQGQPKIPKKFTLPGKLAQFVCQAV